MVFRIELIEDFHVAAIGDYIVKQDLALIKELDKRMMTIDNRQEDGSFIVFTPGIGETKFTYLENEFNFVRIYEGDPVTARTMVANTHIHEFVYIEGKTIELIQNFCKCAVDAIDEEVRDRLSTYVWQADNEFWKRDSCTPKRSFESVILDEKLKKTFLDDVDEFKAADTVEWYKKHGIPLKRGYLLYGPPGTGKSSTITALASYTNRKICRVNLVAPKLNDNSLLVAMNSASKESILVFEDIDALFGTFRKKNEEFNVTFSGLLNAIDGIGDNSRGLIFIFTTNHPERLDPALKRKGRIDVELELTYCTWNQSKAMFLRFYPDNVQEANEFADAVMKCTKKATPAQLQHHFIAMRKCKPSVAKIIDASLFTIDENDVNMWT